jgi:hypothetical protein
LVLWRIFLILILVSANATVLSWSQTSAADDSTAKVQTLPGPVFGDSSRVFGPGSNLNAFNDPVRTNTERPLSMYLARNTRLLFGYELYRASRLECAWEGVGMGMTMGMCAGALGMTAGMWDEDSAWYIAGAMAALGAIWGSVKADDPSWTIRVRWDPDR